MRTTADCQAARLHAFTALQPDKVHLVRHLSWMLEKCHGSLLGFMAASLGAVV
jgi:hypothetical protein